MKTLASLAFGAFALTAGSIGLAQPAAARGDVGVYVGPGGLGISVETYRNYCRDRLYRREHWRYCQRFYDRRYRSDYGYSGYYNNYDYGYYRDRDWRYRDRGYYDRYDYRRYDRDYDYDYDDGDDD